MKNKINKNSTLREVLQIVGTELLREGFNENIHVASTMANIKDIDNVIITDCRFPNELEAVKKRGGITIRVNRPCDICGGSGYHKMSCPVSKSGEHYSEIALDSAAFDDSTFDYEIDNNGTISELIDKIRNILIENKLIKNK